MQIFTQIDWQKICQLYNKINISNWYKLINICIVSVTDMVKVLNKQTSLNHLLQVEITKVL